MRNDDVEALAMRLMRSLEGDRLAWEDHASDDIELIFPFAATVGMPTHVSGKKAAAAYLSGVFQLIEGLTFRDMRASALASGDAVLLTYKGYSDPGGRPAYDQNYAALMEFEGPVLRRFTEYWDTAIVRDVLGPALADRA